MGVAVIGVAAIAIAAIAIAQTDADCKEEIDG
jgi:hypothetical protein